MIDNRIITFLELCTQMNYRKTAESLSMTQPAVTQHIQYLERLYDCALFTYTNRTLQKTVKCLELEEMARSIMALSLHAKKSLSAKEKLPLRIGATKTIGEYTLDSLVHNLICDDSFQLTITIENTETLLDQLNHFSLDVLLLEGYVDQTKYDCHVISSHELIGICGKNHPFANQTVSLQDTFGERLILREPGSGTRAVFESFLHDCNNSLSSYGHQTTFNSYPLIEQTVSDCLGISFVYDVVPQKNNALSTFRLKEGTMSHDFNYVFLKNTTNAMIQALLDLIKISL